MTLDIKESLPEDAKVQEVTFSPQGKYLMTKIRDPVMRSEGTTNVIHAIVTSKQVANIHHSIFTRFSNTDDVAMSVCYKDKTYTVYAHWLNALSRIDDSVFPEGEIFGNIVMTDNSDYMVFIYDLASQKDRVFHQRFPTPGHKLLLLTTADIQRQATSKGKALKEIDYESWRYVGEDDYLLSIHALRADVILLIFAHQVGKPDVKSDIEDFKKQPKVAIVYSIKTNRITKFLRDFLHNDSSVDRLVFSSFGTLILDQSGRMFTTNDSKQISTMTTSGIDHRMTSFLHDGKYVITITLDHKRLIIFSSDKVEIKASIPLHGIAKTVQVARDGQLVVVGLEDGRIQIFRTLLDYMPAMGAAQSLIPTHQFPPAIRARPEMPQDKDEFVESVSTTDPSERQAVKSSEITFQDGVASGGAPAGALRWKKLSVMQKAGTFNANHRPSLKTLTKAITMAHRDPNNKKSRACVIQ